jgi:hypothetical protein
MRFQRNISLRLGRMEARRRVKFIGVELATPVEKAMTGHSGGEDGPCAGESCGLWQMGGAMEREKGGRPHSRVVEMPG